MKLIVVDAYVTLKSPSMRAWVEAFDQCVRPYFEEVQIWASECDIPEGNGVTWIRIAQRIPSWKLHAPDFQLRANRMLAALPADPERIVQSTGCNINDADIHFIHFWHHALLEQSSQRPEYLKLSLLEKISGKIAVYRESKTTTLVRPKRYWWVVSRSLAERIQSGGASGQFRIIPNQYDPSRFHHQVRERWREPMREKYGFEPEEKVFVFSAFGHFERKGLLQGIEAVTELSKRGQRVRYLILGGTPKTLKHFRKKLSAEQEAVCVFAGLVEDIQHHLVAADGLLFPSHFEAFSLAEIEAAALGLRIYLTHHYGAEMILREPINGRWLPWEPMKMADVLEDELRSGDFGRIHDEMGEALDPPSYASRLRELYAEVIQAKSII